MHLLAFMNTSVMNPVLLSDRSIFFFSTGVPGSMLVTWTTFNKTESKVEYGLLGGRLFEMSTKGEATLFVDSGVEKRKMFIHRVTLTGLKPAATYGEESDTTVCWKRFSISASSYLCYFSVSLREQ